MYHFMATSPFLLPFIFACLTMPSCKHANRCGKPNMTVDQFPENPLGFPLLCWFTLRQASISLGSQFLDSFPGTLCWKMIAILPKWPLNRLGFNMNLRIQSSLWSQCPFDGHPNFLWKKPKAQLLAGWWFGTFLFFHILGIIIPVD